MALSLGFQDDLWAPFFGQWPASGAQLQRGEQGLGLRNIPLDVVEVS